MLLSTQATSNPDALAMFHDTVYRYHRELSPLWQAARMLYRGQAPHERWKTRMPGFQREGVPDGLVRGGTRGLCEGCAPRRTVVRRRAFFGWLRPS